MNQAARLADGHGCYCQRLISAGRSIELAVRPITPKPWLLLNAFLEATLAGARARKSKRTGIRFSVRNGRCGPWRGQIDIWFEEAANRFGLIKPIAIRGRPRATSFKSGCTLWLWSGTPGGSDRAVLYYLRSDRVIEVSLTPADLGNHGRPSELWGRLNNP